MNAKCAIVILALFGPFVSQASAATVSPPTPPPVPFPADTASREVVERWIDDNLDLTGYVASGWSRNALFFASIPQMKVGRYPIVRTAVWTEVIDPSAANAAHWRSSVAAVEFDCTHRRYRDLSRLNYTGSSGSGQSLPGILMQAWQAAEPGSTMGTTHDEVCYRAKLAVAAKAGIGAKAGRVPRRPKLRVRKTGSKGVP